MTKNEINTKLFIENLKIEIANFSNDDVKNLKIEIADVEIESSNKFKLKADIAFLVNGIANRFDIDGNSWKEVAEEFLYEVEGAWDFEEGKFY